MFFSRITVRYELLVCLNSGIQPIYSRKEILYLLWIVSLIWALLAGDLITLAGKKLECHVVTLSGYLQKNMLLSK